MGRAPPLDRIRLQLGGRLLKRGLPSLRTSLFSVKSKEAGQHRVSGGLRRFKIKLLQRSQMGSQPGNCGMARRPREPRQG